MVDGREGKVGNWLSFLKSRSLRVDILTAFGGLLIITVVSIIFYYYRSTSNIVRDLSNDLMDQATHIVIQKTTNYLSPATVMAEMSARLTRAGALSLADHKELEIYAIEMMQSHPQIAMINIGDEQGNFLMPKRMPDGTIATKIIDRTVTPPKTTWKYRNRDFQVVKTKISFTDDYDPRRRPWYQGAKKTGGSFWTDLYAFYTDRKLGITAAFPVLGEDGACLGVFGLDMELENLSTFLNSLKIGKTGIVYIYNEKKELVAYPDQARVIDSDSEDGILRTVYVEELGIPSLTASFQKHARTGSQRFVVEAEGRRFLASFSDFPPSFHKPWKVAVVVPEQDFIGGVQEANTIALLICLAILLIAGVLATILSRSISKPILRLAEETERIRDFQLEEGREFPSHIKEIQALQDAVKRMRVSLKSFTRFAPEEIVREVVIKGKEAMLGGERREVTLLFSDLRNFTQLSERNRPEVVVQLLNAHFDAMVDIITGYGGFVVDFLGDSVFAVFGAPLTESGHARRAVSCALEMQLARHRLNRENQLIDHLPLEIGIGLNTGVCVVGNMGSMQRIKYGVVGHAVNLAARLESFSVGGQVLISERTYEELKDVVVAGGPFEAHGKGLEAPLNIWEVQGIQGMPELTLPPMVSGLAQLPRPLDVTLRLIIGKRIDSEAHAARMLKVSPSGAEIETDVFLAPFSDVHLEFRLPQGEAASINGKVIQPGRQGGACLVKFSGVEPRMAEGIRQLAGQESSGPQKA
jgi:adenylate cyclase